MKILYGVNGVGNGHITRSRIMATELFNAGHQVTFLFSGKEKNKFFDMGPFGSDLHYKKGLTFTIVDGRVDIFKTMVDNDIPTLLRDIDDLDVSEYDLVISDFEPIVSWAARLQNKPCIGIGHQYSFDFDIPKAKTNFLLNLFMKWYAPVSQGIGLHWNNFNHNIYPPIVEKLYPTTTIKNTIVVYLAFEAVEPTLKLLSHFKDYTFLVYGFDRTTSSYDNVIIKEPSKAGFLDDLRACDGIICNSGFELISEALSLGKKILTKPLSGQMEQHSNKLALERLGYCFTCDNLTIDIIENFLSNSDIPVKIAWPDVAKHIVEWLPNYKSTTLPLVIWDGTIIRNI